jgi:hypothetical protein
MTIKDDGRKKQPKPSAPTEDGIIASGNQGFVEQLDEEIEAEPEIPMVAAFPVEAVAASTTSHTQIPTSSMISTSAAGTRTTATATTTPQVLVTITPPTTTTMAEGQPHTMPVDARWVRVKRCGPATWTICGVVSVFTCILCCMPCGFWALLFPCDYERAYEHQGKIYDEHGQYLGNARNMRVLWS